MPKYIKSHSNYVLKSFHQSINDGKIYERDITTIGGLNQFAKGQEPIYRSGNFIITVRDDGGISNQYNKKKWDKNNVSGDTWTIASISGLSENIEQNDTKIVLKQDYYDFRDFAYYGSLSEMFRASINDIIKRFPGELYATNDNVYYTSGETIDGELIEDKMVLGDDNLKYVVNPFGINIHSPKKPIDAEPLKYFADDGYKAYSISNEPITSWTSTYYYTENNPSYNKRDENSKKYIRYTATTTSSSIVASAETNTYYPCKGDKVAKIVINNTTEIDAYLGDDNIIYYLSNTTGFNIRPNQKYLDEFYNECDAFQRLLLNRTSVPKYKATFSVIKETEFGYDRVFEDFIFPTSQGGYNIDASSYGFNDYTLRLSEIGQFYDEYFTDNLYRSMTHEAIKNFDWTYTRDFNEGDEEEYVIGGERMQKALRVFAREFDEVLSFINNIKNINRVTYDERNNLPDYFLTDTVENDGWDVLLVTPFNLSGYTDDSDNLSSDCAVLEREFVECSGTVTPYSSGYSDNPNGFFITCCGGKSDVDYIDPPCGYPSYDDPNCKYYFIDASSSYTKYDSCSGVMRTRIRPYFDETEYTYHDVNNEFLRRLKLNSRYILRHKGTIEGIEMILGMFGLKSKRWVDSNSNPCINGFPYDYEISEYVASASSVICDSWDAVHDMYHIDWINSTKNIVYEYRNISNYNSTNDVNYIPYQGLPVIYVDKKDGTRDLYPNFNKYEQYDGNPYFQMNGGWLDKSFVYNGNTYHFQYDSDDSLIASNESFFKETVRNIRRFDDLRDMLSVPSYEISDGQIVYVSNIDDNTGVLDGMVYHIKTDNYGRYIELIKENGAVRAGDDLYFTEYVRVYNKYMNQESVFINEIPNGQTIKCYLSGDSITCSDDMQSYDTWEIISNETAYTNYFIIDDFSMCNRLSTNNNGGWRRLSRSCKEYKSVDTIINYNEGNNPHNGNMVYDNGLEYFKYFEQVFKYAIENDRFDERCYDNYEYTLENEIKEIGFEFSGDVDSYYIKDGKIHQYVSDDDEIKKKITNDILNTKVIVIDFKLHYDLFSEKGQCELKYINDVILNYATQMIPSTAILQIKFS